MKECNGRAAQANGYRMDEAAVSNMLKQVEFQKALLRMWVGHESHGRMWREGWQCRCLHPVTPPPNLG